MKRLVFFAFMVLGICSVYSQDISREQKMVAADEQLRKDIVGTFSATFTENVRGVSITHDWVRTFNKNGKTQEKGTLVFSISDRDLNEPIVVTYAYEEKGDYKIVNGAISFFIDKDGFKIMPVKNRKTNTITKAVQELMDKYINELKYSVLTDDSKLKILELNQQYIKYKEDGTIRVAMRRK